MFNNEGLFINLFFQLCIFITITFLLLEIRNLNNNNKKLNQLEIFFNSTVTFSPFALFIAVSYFIYPINNIIGIIFIIAGYALSLKLVLATNFNTK